MNGHSCFLHAERSLVLDTSFLSSSFSFLFFFFTLEDLVFHTHVNDQTLLILAHSPTIRKVQRYNQNQSMISPYLTIRIQGSAHSQTASNLPSKHYPYLPTCKRQSLINNMATKKSGRKRKKNTSVEKGEMWMQIYHYIYLPVPLMFHAFSQDGFDITMCE